MYTKYINFMQIYILIMKFTRKDMINCNNLTDFNKFL